MKFGFIFPGYGSQFVGMGKEFYDSSKEARVIFDQADQIIPNLNDVIFNGPAEKLTLTREYPLGEQTISLPGANHLFLIASL